jgi:hypothetical protein
MFNQTITEQRDYGAGGENRWSRQGPSNVVEGWHSSGAGIGMSYVRVGDRVIACGRGSEWGPGQRPRGTNYWDQAGARARRGYEWEPAKPRVKAGPTQEEIDAIVQRQIEATKNKVADLQARIAAMTATMANSTAHKNATHEFDPNQFGIRVYKCLAGKSANTDLTIDPTSPHKDDQNTGAKGVAYRHSPVWEDKDEGGHGPIHPMCVLADRICQGNDCVYIRDAVRKKWLPMSTKVSKDGVTLPNGGKLIFKLMGFYSGPNKINIEAMNLKFNDGSDKLDAGADFGSPDPWHNHAGGKPANFP